MELIVSYSFVVVVMESVLSWGLDVGGDESSAADAAVLAVEASHSLWPGILDIVLDKNPEKCLVHPASSTSRALKIRPVVAVLVLANAERE